VADNVGYTPGTGTKIASREVNYSGETAQAQSVGLVSFSGPDDAKTATDISDANPLPIEADRTDNMLAMLSRIVKLLESNAVVDQQQRQRVTLDAIAASLTLGTITTVSTVSTVSSVTNVAAQTGMAGMDREMYINIAKTTYATAIRPRLTFA
jgi:hypothetical protein